MMFKNKRIRLCFSLLVLMVFAGVGSAWGQEPSANQLLPAEKQDLAWKNLGFRGKSLPAESWLTSAADISTDSSEQPFLMAQADTDKGDEEESLSPECMEWRKDPDADIGVMLRAGCQPTIGQMSALMDNPLGNVAMLFFQFECIGISPIYWPPARSAYASERRLGMMSGKKVCSTKKCWICII
jgi:hypothetical protein